MNMALSRNNFGHRRANLQPGENSQIPLTNRTNIDYRNSAINQYKLTFEQQTSPNYNRYSYDHEPHTVLVKRSLPKDTTKITSFQNIRNTLTLLKKRIQTAKQELQGNRILGKTIILEEDDEESKTFELISFNGSSGSHKISEISLDQTKRSFLQKLRKNEIADISQVKGYYKSEVVRGLKEGTSEILNHIALNWRILRSCGSLTEPSSEVIRLKSANLQTQKTGKRTIVFGLDGTLVHVDWQKKGQEDIDVQLKLDDNQVKPAYLCLRPYAMTFLKKMSKQFEIIIFSDRSRDQTEAIMEVLDPFRELVKTRLCKDNCVEIRKGLWTKDLRVIERDLSQMLLIDNQPYSYLFQIDNAVPILPFRRGNDDQLYALQKYLLQAFRTADLRKFNRNYLQLYRYCEFGDALQAVRNLYMVRK